jgi:hypothetical protein
MVSELCLGRHKVMESVACIYMKAGRPRCLRSTSCTWSKIEGVIETEIASGEACMCLVDQASSHDPAFHFVQRVRR